MSNQFTPGPWCLFEVGDRTMRLCPGKRDADGQGGESLLTIVEEDGVSFAAVQRDEDARLIAAAPDLLQAAKAVAFSNGFDAAYPDKLDALCAAIRKATGES